MSKFDKTHIDLVYKRLATIRDQQGASLDLSNLARATALICGITERRVFQVKKECNGKRVASNRPQRNTKAKRQKLSRKILDEVGTYCQQKLNDGAAVTWLELHSMVEDISGIELSPQTLTRELKAAGYVKSVPRNRPIETKFMQVRKKAVYDLIKCHFHGRKDRRKNLVFLDESYINIHHKAKTTVFLKSGGGFWNSSSGKGDRYIIIGAGSSDGWVKNSIEIWRAKKSTGDYHGNMNGKIFMKWFQKKLLPNLPDPTIIFMDNAGYHKCKDGDMALGKGISKMRKFELQEYLTENQISWDGSMLKPALYALVKSYRDGLELAVEKEAATFGHKIFWLPPNMSYLNPIEHMWGVAKNHVARQYSYTSSSKDILMKNLNVGLDNCTPEVWDSAIKKLLKYARKEEVPEEERI